MTEYENDQNEELIEAWEKVFDQLMESLDMKYVLSDILPKVQDMPGLKNPFPKRKRGNKLITFMALKLGEKGFDSSNILLKLILSLCHDINYKIRLDGIKFLKEYL